MVLHFTILAAIGLVGDAERNNLGCVSVCYDPAIMYLVYNLECLYDGF